MARITLRDRLRSMSKHAPKNPAISLGLGAFAGVACATRGLGPWETLGVVTISFWLWKAILATPE